MDYYILEGNKLPVIRHLVFNGGGFGVDFLKGNKINPEDFSESPYILFENEKIELPSYFEADGTPIIHQSLVEVLTKGCADQFLTIPVEIKFSNEVVTGYSILNIERVVKCVDIEKSKCTTFGSVVKLVVRMHHLILNKEPLEGIHLFRAKEYKSVIFVSEILKKELENAGISGHEFREADGYGDGHRF